MRYGFECKSCGEQQEEIMTVSAYEVVMGTVGGGLSDGVVKTGLSCDACGSDSLKRAHSDLGSQYTEKQMFWDDDTSPAALRGKGGYSRERKKILEAAGFRQKDTGKRHRRHNAAVTVGPSTKRN